MVRKVTKNETNDSRVDAEETLKEKAGKEASKMGGDIREPKLVVPCACLFGTSRPLAWHRRTRRPFRSAPLADQRHVRQRPEHRGCCFLLAKLGRKLQGRVSFIDSLAQVGVRG